MERDEEDNESVRDIFLSLFCHSNNFSSCFRHHHPQKLQP